MPEEEVLDDNHDQDPSSGPDATQESSPEETQTAEATAQQAAENAPFHEHPAWISFRDRKESEVQDLKNQLNEVKQQAGLSQKQVLDVLQNAISGKGQDEGPLANADQQTKEWAERFLKPVVNSIVKPEIDRAKKEASEPLLNEVKMYRDMVGSVIADSFLSSHPDVKKGSPEMGRIVQKAQQEAAYGKDIRKALDDAYKVEMFDSNAQSAVEKVKQQQQVKNKQKQAANLETQSIPKNQLPAQPNMGKEISADEFASVAKELGTTLPPG